MGENGPGREYSSFLSNIIGGSHLEYLKGNRDNRNPNHPSGRTSVEREWGEFNLCALIEFMSTPKGEGGRAQKFPSDSRAPLIRRKFLPELDTNLFRFYRTRSSIGGCASTIESTNTKAESSDRISAPN